MISKNAQVNNFYSGFIRACTYFPSRRMISPVALIETMMILLLCLPLLSDYDAWGLIRTAFNRKSPMDIGYIGDVMGGGGNAIDISAKPVLNDIQWIVDSKNIHRFTAKLRSHRMWTEYTITLQSRRQGDVSYSPERTTWKH